MKKSIILICSLAAVLVSCNEGPKREQLVSEIDSLRNVIVERDASLDEMIATINVVEEGFRSINEAQGRININTAGAEKNDDRLNENFTFISNTLAKNIEQGNVYNFKLTLGAPGEEIKFSVDSVDEWVPAGGAL